MNMKAFFLGIFITFFLFCISCQEYTPKPRGYFRIEQPKAEYKFVYVDQIPVGFNLSSQATIVRGDKRQETDGLTISYPSLAAKIYCSYLPITPSSFKQVDLESRILVERLLTAHTRVSEKIYEHPEVNVYGSLFFLEGDLATPIQFTLTDSASHFFRGALYFDCKPNSDSLAPAIQYIRNDIIELIQTFSWNK